MPADPDTGEAAGRSVGDRGPTGGDVALLAVLEQARRHGFLGSGPVGDHVRLARALVSAVARPPHNALDLGSGGGVPGLVLAGDWPDSQWVLLDSSDRRTLFLREATARLELAGRVQVARARAELAGRDVSLRGRFDLVVARSFGPPAVTAECAAPFLRLGGQLVVTEPPDGPTDRWPTSGLDLLGLRLTDRSVEPGWVAFSQTRPCPLRYPRPVGRPAKRPLWSTPAT